MIRLIVHRPDRLPESHTYTEPTEISIGRSLSCTYCIDADPLASRLHAAIIIDPPDVRIKDLNSTNGIFINGERFGIMTDQPLSHPTDLKDGDEVIIGQTRIIVVTGESTVAPGIRLSPSPGPAAPLAGSDSMQTIAALPPVAGYRLIRLLSPAPTGSVYLGVDEESGRQVAVKILAPEVPFTPKTLDDFREEIAAVRNIEHPNLVRLLDSGELARGGVYLVMEHVEGPDLQEFLALHPDNRLPLEEAKPFMMQLADAVCHLHRHGFMHMDIKPASIIVPTRDGVPQPKITDQGFARFLDETGILPRGYDGQEEDRLAYIPPEELNPVAEPKSSADVFCLCAVFYRLLTGAYPYRFVEGEDNREAVENGRIVPIEERLPGLPEPLVVIIDRGLALDPDMRYQAGCDILDALETINL